MHHNDNFKHREYLKQKVINAFAEQAEIYQIFFFGREVEGKSDCFSDIDMIVCSSDLARTQSKYLSIFDTISAVIETFPLASTTNHFAAMVMLEDYSPYQKVDFSILSDISEKAEFGPFLLMYENKEKPKMSQTKMNVLPLRKNVAHKLNDLLFSVPRFTKCLFRRDFDMYRRWKSITDVTLVLLYEKHFGWRKETLQKSLTVPELKELHEKLDIKEMKLFSDIYPSDGKLNLALSYQASIDLFIELSKQKAEYFGIVLNFVFIEYIKQFMDLEINYFNSKMPSN